MGATVDELFGVEASPRRQFPHPERARVHRVDGSGLHVTLFSQGHEFTYGPCRWSRPSQPVDGDPAHDHDVGLPPAGTECLVVFSDRGSAEPWVIAFAGWPS